MNLRTARRQFRTALIYGVLLIGVCFSVFPFYWIVTTSLKFPRDHFSKPPVYMPTDYTLSHYHELFDRATINALPFLKNSFTLASLNMVFVVALSVPAAYGLARFNIGGQGTRFALLFGRMLPPVILIIPLFLIFRHLHLNDSFLGLVLAYTIFNGPLAVWLLMAFFEDFPTEIIDASLVDGSTELQALRRIVVPLMAPSVVVVALFCFLTGWNDLIFVLTLGGRDTQTLNLLMVNLLNAPSNESFGSAAAAVVLGIIPPFVLTLFLQRYLAAGLALGGVKGLIFTARTVTDWSMERTSPVTTQEYRYNRLTWPEIDAAIARQPVVILPTGSTEQHGRHLPIDVDLFLTESICLEVGKRADGKVLVLPPISYGLNLHHIDFPGTIHIEPEVFVAFAVNVTKSVAYHGFEKILVVNGHGSNQPLIDLIARQTTLETNSLCAAIHYFNLALDRFHEIKETPVIAHADEFETSLYLHLAADRVQMDKAGKADDVMGKYLSSDSTGLARFNDYWSRWTDLGVHGDATVATAEKGEIIFEETVARMLELVDEWRAWPIAERRSFHSGPVQSQIRW